MQGTVGLLEGAGGFSGARNPEPPRNFWLGLHFLGPGRAGAIPGRRLRTGQTASVCGSGVKLTTMQQLLCALAGLALLRAGAGQLSQAPRDTPGQRAAESPSSPGEDPAWSPGCDRHYGSRLDIIEETVEKTVEHLEAEVTGLLGLLQELAPNLPPGPFSPNPDVLGDDGF